jgi:hypothetical protein
MKAQKWSGNRSRPLGGVKQDEWITISKNSRSKKVLTRQEGTPRGDNSVANEQAGGGSDEVDEVEIGWTKAQRNDEQQYQETEGKENVIQESGVQEEERKKEAKPMKETRSLTRSVSRAKRDDPPKGVSIARPR